MNIAHSRSQVNMKSLPLTQADYHAWVSLLAQSSSNKANIAQQQAVALGQTPTAVSWGTWAGEQLVATFTARLVSLSCPQRMGDAPRIALAQAPIIHPQYESETLYKLVTRPVIESLRRQGVQAIFQVEARPLWASWRATPPGYQLVGELRPYWGWLVHRPTAVSLLHLTSQCPDELAPLPPHTQISFSLDVADVRARYCAAREPYQFALHHEQGMVTGLVVYKTASYRLGLSGAHLVAVYGVDTQKLVTRWLATMYAQGHRLVQTTTNPHAAVRDALRQHTQQIGGRFRTHRQWLYAQPLQRYVPPRLFDQREWNWVN